MTGLSADQLAELLARLREVVGDWERPPMGRPPALTLVAAVVAVLFGLRHNIADDVVAELFGCSQATITRYHQRLGPILRWVLRGEADEQYARAQREGVLVDGFIAPVGNRADCDGLFSGKRHVNGENVQVVPDLDGHVADVGDPLPGARHDAAAFFASGIAERWAGHYASGGPGMTGDKGYLGTGVTCPQRKPPGGELSARQKTWNTSVNRIRAAVERAIAHLKSWKILKTGYRRIMRDFPDILRTVTLLEIYRVWEPTSVGSGAGAVSSCWR